MDTKSTLLRATPCKELNKAYDSLTLSLYYFEKFVGTLVSSGISREAFGPLAQIRDFMVDLRKVLKQDFNS